MKFLFSVILFCTVNASATDKTDSFSRYFKLLPEPQKIELRSGKGIAYNTLHSIDLQNGATQPILYGYLKSLPLKEKGGKGILTLSLSENDVPESPEGYVLEIKGDQVIINARAQAGLFYGCQTLLQLLEDARDQQVKIPACRITDYPDITYRAIHLDLKHHVDVIGYYYEMMDRLARIKVNAVIVEFEDKLRYRKAPAVGASDAIPVEQFAAISRYARERNIEISPLVQGLGHAAFILKHEQYKKLREDPTSDWAFSPLDPGTYDVQFSLYEDAMAATPGGKYLHVGGDEVGNLGMSELSKKSGMKSFELQMHWLNKVSAFAKEHDRIPIFWDDMVFKLAGLYQTTYDPKMSKEAVEKIWQENKNKLDENIHLFPQNCVYMRWNYGAPTTSGNIKAINWYKSHNLNAMAATAAQTSWNILPRNHSNFQPIKDFCRITSDKKLNGILCTAWDDSSPHIETYWRGFHFFSLFSWNHKDIDLQDAGAIFRHRFYAPALENKSFAFQDELEQSLSFWETALVEKGRRSNSHKSIDLISLPDYNEPGAWSKKYATKIAEAKKTIKQYETIHLQIQRSMKLARRNRYSLSLMNEINNLHVYPAKLLIQIEDYDLSDINGKKKKLKDIQSYMASFDSIRKAFEEIFSQTRILEKPADYMLDQNHHSHLANATINSDWMYVFELAMNDKIRKWELLQKAP